ncbi:hypothetical protein [Streptomyces cellulosae]|uniref:Transferase n=1 Tax=Streptomyces cellulosae TaxID=1968 RepID=A0ABW7YCL9_STRCE
MTVTPDGRRIRYTLAAWLAGIIAFISMNFAMTGLGLALDGDWVSLLTVPVAVAGCLIGLWTARRHIATARTVKRRDQPELPSLTMCRAMTYLLYLRPFAEDGRLATIDPLVGGRARLPYARMLGLADSAGAEDSWEEQIVGLFRPCGEVVAVGSPGERFAFPGAKRFYLPRDDWRQPVSVGMRRARLVLLVAGIGENAKGADGTLWEFTEAVRLLPPSRLLLLVCGSPEDYRRFCDAAAGAFKERSERLLEVGEPPVTLPVLPGHPAIGEVDRRHPLRGVVQFDDTWTGEFTAFDPAAEAGGSRRRNRAMVRHQMEPFIASLEPRLPGEAAGASPFRYAHVAGELLNSALMLSMAGWLMGRTHTPFLMRAVDIVFMASVFLGEARTAISTERHRARKNVTILPPPPPPTARSARSGHSPA